jgi:Ca2+-binding EF-hand superfamily protein
VESSFDDMSINDDQSSVLQRNFGNPSMHMEPSLDGSSMVDDDSSLANQTQVSGLYSFAPYHIDDDNVQLMNTLFDENALWRDINDTTLNMHKVGNALDDSVDGGDSSVANGGLSLANSSTSEFWDSLYQRYNYPEPYKPAGHSVTRHRLESAVRDGNGVSTMPHRLSRTAERKSKNASQLYPSLSKSKSARQPLFSLTTDIPVNSISDHMSVDAMHTEAIVPDYLTKLDPLSINVTTTLRSLVRQRLKSEAGDDSSVGAASVLIEGRHNDSALINSQSVDNDLDSFDDGLYNSDGVTTNTFFSSKVTTNRTRIKAEKLTDMKFIRRMFNEKRMTVTDTQELISKLEDILELMDKDNTGYVSWKVFSRVLVSISPKHLLRADVEAFLAAQVDNEDDLIDYKEFSISGKVMVVENKEGVGQILARSWYSRQKKNKMLTALGDNDPTSTYTWKNHVKWFKKRKSDALIWLMRRANRAIQYYSYVETAQSYLLQIGIFGKALTGLIESGTRALDALDVNRNIRIALSKRAIHARDYRRKREEARQFLYYKSHPEVLTPQEAKRKEGLRIQKEMEQHSSKAFSPSISKVYRLIYVTKEATEYLKQVAIVAHKKCRRIDIAYDWLSGLGRRTVLQEKRHQETQEELFAMGEKARQYCVHIDKAIMGLFRWGEFALRFFDLQDAGLKWLLNRGIEAKTFMDLKEKSAAELLHCGSYTLETLNSRENAFSFLSDRAIRSQDLRRNQLAAVKYLRKIPEKIYANELFVDDAYEYLLVKARHALKHQDRTMRSAKYLMTIASRSVAVTRKRTMAQADLKQVMTLVVSLL